MPDKSAKKSARIQYTLPHQIDPLLPRDPEQKLAAMASRLARESARLGGSAHPSTREKLRELLRAMNSYYSNRIEGEGTHPANIERALRKDFSKQPNTARLQRLAVAHVEAERDLEAAAVADPLTAGFAMRAHRELYRRLTEADRTTADGVVVQPGELREVDVEIREHLAPAASAVPGFLARYEETYRMAAPDTDSRLIAVAAAHHRLAWIHPFVDGNGRATRLVSHAGLFPWSEGLWSICRALARARDGYFDALKAADAPRRGDLDGRGNLSDEGLFRWCSFFLELCLDQVGFMTRLLDLDQMKRRILALITFRATTGKVLKPEVSLPLHHVFAAGPLSRGEFKQLTGLSGRSAQRQVQALLDAGLLTSPTPLGELSFGMPLDALQFLFPDLYPEAATRAEP